MGVDVYLRWTNQTEAESNTDGYIRGAGASQVLFEECWEPELVERGRRILEGLPVKAPAGVAIEFSELVADGAETPEGRGASSSDDEKPETPAEDSADESADDEDDDDFENEWKPFPAAILRRREKTARRHVWAFAKHDMNARGITDGKKIHQLFLERWLPYKEFIELAEKKERETGQPVEIRVSY